MITAADGFAGIQEKHTGGVSSAEARTSVSAYPHQDHVTFYLLLSNGHPKIPLQSIPLVYNNLILGVANTLRGMVRIKNTRKGGALDC